MSKTLKITLGKQPEKDLNKEQRRFNALVQKISLLRKDIQLARELDLELRRIGEEHLEPNFIKSNAAFREWIFALHHHPAKGKLPKKLAEKFPLLMMEEMAPLLFHHSNQDDVELQELYAFYEGSGRSFEEIQAANERNGNEIVAEDLQEIFGIEVDSEDLADPEKMREKMEAKQATLEAEHQEYMERQRNRKRGAAAAAAAEKRQAAQTSVKKTAKQIYLDLVRNFHPDKEPDDQKRIEKTEIMQQITAAYQADDHLRLLELQMNLLASRDNAFAAFDNAQLKYFNQTLQQQVAELEQELYFSSPEGNGNVYGHLYDPNRTQMLRNVESYIQSIKKAVKGVRHNLSLIRDEKLFREYIDDYDIADFWSW